MRIVRLLCGKESEHQVLNGSHIFVSYRNFGITQYMYNVLTSNIGIQGDKMKKENNPKRLPFETAHFLHVSYNAKHPTKEFVSLDACINTDCMMINYYHRVVP